MLLELLHRVAAHAGANGMDAGALGEVFAPCIAWQPPPPKKVRSILNTERPVCAFQGCCAGSLFGTNRVDGLPHTVVYIDDELA